MATRLRGGDSGGPAFVTTERGLELAGLSPFQDAPGRHLGKYGVTEVYTRVSRYQEFIDEHTGDEWDGNVGARLLYKMIGFALLSRVG